jgi:hypothetical protein
MNWKDVEGSCSNLIKDIILAFVWRDWGKVTKILSKDGQRKAKIKTEYKSEANLISFLKFTVRIFTTELCS